METREACASDLTGLLQLYTNFNKEAVGDTVKASEIWRQIMDDPNHHILVAEDNMALISSCVAVIVPNLTHGGRPYTLIENVVTEERYRCKGYATAVLNAAKELALREGCYKLMLMTGSKLDSTLKFYERAGYNKNDKTAFIQWL
jgi:GNAT superfamily N-acetyltransferase